MSGWESVNVSIYLEGVSIRLLRPSCYKGGGRDVTDVTDVTEVGINQGRLSLTFETSSSLVTDVGKGGWWEVLLSAPLVAIF